MRGIILSAGAGSRLLPLTEHVPKCLVEVAGRAILDHQLAALAAAGMTQATVVAGYRHAQVIDHLAETAPPLAVEVIFNPFWAASSSIGSVWAARGHLARPFCLMNGDTVFDGALIADAVGHTGDGTALLVERIAAAPALDDMLVEARDGYVRAVSKDLDATRATHRSLGVILCGGDGAAYRAALEAVIGAPNGIHAFHHAIVDRLARPGPVLAVESGGAWQEIDRPEDMLGWER